MSNFDPELFKVPPDPNLICSICHFVLCGPVEFPCRHIFCRVCIETWLDSQCSCPSCRKRVRKTDLCAVSPVIVNIINALQMQCLNYVTGCPQVLVVENFNAHIEICEYKEIECGFEKCKVKIFIRDKASHEAICEFREVKCQKKCGQMVLANLLNNHDCVATLLQKLRTKEEELKRLFQVERDLRHTAQTLQVQIDEMNPFVDAMVGGHDYRPWRPAVPPMALPHINMEDIDRSSVSSAFSEYTLGDNDEPHLVESDDNETVPIQGEEVEVITAAGHAEPQSPQSESSAHSAAPGTDLDSADAIHSEHEVMSDGGRAPRWHSDSSDVSYGGHSYNDHSDDNDILIPSPADDGDYEQHWEVFSHVSTVISTDYGRYSFTPPASNYHSSASDEVYPLSEQEQDTSNNGTNDSMVYVDDNDRHEDALRDDLDESIQGGHIDDSDHETLDRHHVSDTGSDHYLSHDSSTIKSDLEPKFSSDPQEENREDSHRRWDSDSEDWTTAPSHQGQNHTVSSVTDNEAWGSGKESRHSATEHGETSCSVEEGNRPRRKRERHNRHVYDVRDGKNSGSSDLEIMEELSELQEAKRRERYKKRRRHYSSSSSSNSGFDGCLRKRQRGARRTTSDRNGPSRDESSSATPPRATTNHNHSHSSVDSHSHDSQDSASQSSPMQTPTDSQTITAATKSRHHKRSKSASGEQSEDSDRSYHPRAATPPDLSVSDDTTSGTDYDVYEPKSAAHLLEEYDSCDSDKSWKHGH